VYELHLRDEELMVLDMVRRFAEEKVKPIAAKIDATDEFNRDLFREMAALGLMGISLPERYGGSGLSLLCTTVVIETIAAASGSVAQGLAAHYLGTDPLLHFGTEAQKRKYLPALASGEMLAAFAITEPNAGSDIASIQTTARWEGDVYVLNGRKVFTTNGGEAEFYSVFAKTDPEKGRHGISAFIVEKGMPGFSFGKKEDKMGFRGSSTRELIFENVELPVENRLGEEGQGFYIALQAIDTGKIVTAAYALGLAVAALGDAVEYAKQRVQFGRPIAQFQGVQFMLAEMKLQVEAARLLTYYAAVLADQGRPFSTEAALAKWMASDAAMQVTCDAVQIHGGYGYMKEFAVERYMRDAKVTQILEGTNQIQRIVVARALLQE
jgi:alkylation response protein AidB-like acyl-CoA dehydrogenase